MHRILSVAALALLLVGMDVRAEEVSLPYQKLTLRGELRVPEGKNMAAGPLVLMTHGTLAHGRMEIMQTVQDLLADKGYASLAINLSFGQDRRVGMVDCAMPQNHRHTDAMNEIGAWLAWLKGKGANQVVLLGHSRGGNQTAWFAAEHDDAAISRVVLIAPMTWSKKGAGEGYRREHGKDLRAAYGKAEKELAKGKGDALLQGVGFLHCPEASVTAASFVDYYREEPRFDTPSLLKHIKKPVLVIAGSEDNVVANLVPDVEPLADGKRVQLQIIDGADHFFRDLYAEEAVDHIAVFIGE
jgi:pimeloyl-ACP methyl ester carboxylesterase